MLRTLKTFISVLPLRNGPTPGNFDDVMFTSLERLFGYKFSFSCPALFVHGQNSLLTSGDFLTNIKSIYSDTMDFIEVDGAAHHVPLDKPLEIVNIIKERLF